MLSKAEVIKSREFVSLAAALIIDWIIASICKIHVLLVDAMFSFIFFFLLLLLSMAIMKWMMPRCWREWNEILISHNKIMRFQIVLIFASSCKGNFVFQRNYYIFSFLKYMYITLIFFFFSIIQLLYELWKLLNFFSILTYIYIILI